MKKFIITVTILAVVYITVNYLHYHLGIYIDLAPKAPVATFTKNIGKEIYVDQGEGMEPFEIRGVNMGVGIPGKFATEYAISQETYLRWFENIQQMGANTIRVYTLLHDDFYNAFYQYNKDNPEPLYLIHGLWVNDYVHNSRIDAYEDQFLQTLLDDSRKLVDIIHGQRKMSLGRGLGNGTYNKDISQWVIGYILGVEWEDLTVAYTDNKRPENSSYRGKYMYTTAEASPFEALLAQVGDKIIEYESKRYKTQRLVAFANWATTDPFDYPEHIADFFYKIAKVDVEHIRTTDEFLSGTFASYHIYPYHPDYLAYIDDPSAYVDKSGKVNTYYSYLQMINQHHSIPVVIAEFGAPTSRGMAQRDRNTGRHQGRMSEKSQGRAIVECYNDIKDAGCAGAIIFTWQDEWFKRTWNTMHAVDLTKTPYWSDYQTNEQYFGLLSFDPGREQSICYVDGNLSEWNQDDLVVADENHALFMKYDEKFLYFLAHKKGFDGSQVLYIPIDTTQKTGSTHCSNYDINFARAADFVIVINGTENSRVLVQERYDVLRAMYLSETDGKNPYVEVPDKNTPVFKKINLILQTATPLISGNIEALAEVYETGLLTYGNANPASAEFNSLADFCFSGEYVEIKLPWQLLNFSNPAEMTVHDDYYQHYGIENLSINKMYAGIGSKAPAGTAIPMGKLALKPWGRSVTYHERLKSSYYIVQEMWAQRP